MRLRSTATICAVVNWIGCGGRILQIGRHGPGLSEATIRIGGSGPLPLQMQSIGCPPSGSNDFACLALFQVAAMALNVATRAPRCVGPIEPGQRGGNMAGLAPFFVETFAFAGGRPIPNGRLAEPFDTLQSAKINGEREISAVARAASRLGFRIFDMTGKEVFRSRPPDNNQ